MEYKKLPKGINAFSEMIEKGYYYVDKTMLIEGLLKNEQKQA